MCQYTSQTEMHRSLKIMEEMGLSGSMRVSSVSSAGAGRRMTGRRKGLLLSSMASSSLGRERATRRGRWQQQQQQRSSQPADAATGARSGRNQSSRRSAGNSLCHQALPLEHHSVTLGKLLQQRQILLFGGR